MSKPRASNVFLAGGTIAEQDMLAYLRNELSQEQRQQFEKLLAEDPFAQDALEGLQAAESVNAAGRIANIRHRISEKTGAKETRLIQIHWINYAYAAVVFGVLVGVGFLVIHFAGNNKNELALNKPVDASAEQTLFEEKADSAVTETSTAELLADTIAIAVNTKAEDAGGTVAMESLKNQASENVAKAVTTTSSKTSTDMNSTIVATSNADAAVSGAAKASMQREGIRASEESKVMNDAKRNEVAVRSEAAARQPEATQKKAEAEKSTSASTSLDDAMKSFNAASYQKASEQFDEVLKRDPDNTEALYFGGISDYLNGKSAKSEKSFDKLVKTNRYTEGSKWYKANILLKKGKKEEATKLLNELSGSSGMYKERAIKKLEELK
jgi:hypothetical protein